jgi:hypothetical protein
MSAHSLLHNWAIQSTKAATLLLFHNESSNTEKVYWRLKAMILAPAWVRVDTQGERTVI